jgi:hypothetical protein
VVWCKSRVLSQKVSHFTIHIRGRKNGRFCYTTADGAGGWGGKFGREAGRILMLTAYGLEPVAPVRGRSEEEMPFAFSLSLVPGETFGVIQSSLSGLPAWGFGTGLCG